MGMEKNIVALTLIADREEKETATDCNRLQQTATDCKRLQQTAKQKNCSPERRK